MRAPRKRVSIVLVPGIRKDKKRNAQSAFFSFFSCILIPISDNLTKYLSFLHCSEVARLRSCSHPCAVQGR